ncbi:MAG: hypothetical protein EZS28_019046 [Streblomastix strix]|uniref:Uncharacterized protein n=1 Tax=Streblomastix strix TaxID=222440 RepID=A0A5J4VSN8_9EUKA|nr:MAG: hypothetical protein EZS28_019046 [Streblomastix strix]
MKRKEKKEAKIQQEEKQQEKEAEKVQIKQEEGIEPIIPIDNQKENQKEEDDQHLKSSNTPVSTSAFEVPLPLREQLQRDERVKQFLLKQLAKTADEHNDRVRRFAIPKGLFVLIDLFVLF